MQPGVIVSDYLYDMDPYKTAIDLKAERNRTSCENQPIHSKPVHRICSHSPVQIHVIPLGDLRHLCSVCSLS